MRPRKHGKRGFKVDKQATAAKKYLHPRSFVDVHGGEHLYGSDMTARRHEVYTRDKGRCMLIASPLCRGWANWEDGELDHIISRGKGGSDDLDNVRWACKPCHRKRHVMVQWSHAENMHGLPKGI